jgi:dTDP-4-dehydrorhamnose reductase
VYHVSSSPISKFDLLRMVARAYDHHIEIAPDDTLSIDRSLNSGRFQRATGYNPPNWKNLVNLMKRTRLCEPIYDQYRPD